MKTLSLIAGLVLGTGVAGVAQSSADIRTVNEKSVAVWSTGGPSMVQIFIKDAENNVVHKESLHREETVAKRFNLKGLERGKYKVEIEDDEFIRTFSIDKGRDIEIEGEEMVMRTPVLKQKGASIFISAQNSPSVTSISIFDSENDLVYQKRLKKNETRVQHLDLSKIDNGTYTISIVTDGRTFDHEILKD